MTESAREWKILEFIRNKPGVSKEEVVRHMKNDISRITVLNILYRLEEEHMIVARKKKHNSQIYNLFINEDNLIVSVNLDLEDLKIAFFNLVDKTREKFGEKGPVPEQRRLYPNIYDLSHLLIFLYRQIFGTYIISSLVTWSNEIKDKETLNTLYTSVFLKMSEIQLKLSQILNSSSNSHWKDPVSSMIPYFLTLLDPIQLEVVVKNFQMYGLAKHLEPIIDSLWKTNAPYIPLFKHGLLSEHDYPELKQLDDFDDWRKLIKTWELVRNKNKIIYRIGL